MILVGKVRQVPKTARPLLFEPLISETTRSAYAGLPQSQVFWLSERITEIAISVRGFESGYLWCIFRK